MFGALILAATLGFSAKASFAPANATVRIERPAIASALAWKQTGPGPQRHERQIRDGNGQPQVLRLFEYE
jgi:hypothetical protein